MDQQPATGKQLDEMLALTQAAFGAVTDNMQQDNAVAPIVGPSSAGADMFTRSKHVHSGTEHSEEMRSSTPATDVSHPEAYTMSSKSYSSRSQSPAVAGMNVSSNTSGSSTASDVLIRSTVINPPNQLIDKISEFGHSTISLSSISSSNNSVNGSRKIKVKAKHLREIKSPFEDANKSRGETPVPRVPPALIPVEKSDNEPKKKVTLPEEQPTVHSTRPLVDHDQTSRPVISKTPVAVAEKAMDSLPTVDNVITEEKLPPSFDAAAQQNDQQNHNMLQQPSTSTIYDVLKVRSLTNGSSVLLKQGSPEEGVVFSKFSQQQDNLEVTDFRLKDKEKIIRDQFSQRSTHAAPVKRLVQPKLIMQRSEHPKGPGSARSVAKQRLAGVKDSDVVEDSVTTAVAATAAAVAAAAPMIKAQSDLEAKINAMMDKLSGFEDARLKAEQEQHVQHAKELEKQVDELTQIRLKHLEDMQKEQLNLHAKLIENHTRSKQDSRPAYSTDANIYTSTPNYSVSVPSIAQPSRLPNHKMSQPGKLQSRYHPAAVFHPMSDASPVHIVSKPTQTSPLDTPAPRKKPPTPLPSQPTEQPKPEVRGLLEEILSPSNYQAVQNIPTPTIGVSRPAMDNSLERSPEAAASSALVGDANSVERQANKLVQDLGQLKKEMRTVLKGAHKLQTDTEQRLHLAKIHEEVKSDVDRRHEVMAGPAPIDQYLTKPAVSSPITYHAPAKLPSSPALMNAPIIDGCAEAQKTLLKVQASKGYLDTNLDVVAHAATNEELYSLIDRMMYDRDAAEKAYIRAKVDKMIHVMNYEIQDEMLYGKDDKIQVVPQKDKLPDKSSAAKTKGKPGKKKVQAKINTGLRKKRVEEEDDSKENKPQKLPVKKPQKSTSHMQDEQYLSRVYGKALYGPKRKTDKTGPYLRFQSTPVKPGGTRPKVVQEVQAVKMKSSKTQTTPSPKKPKLIKEKTEFYFNPYQHLPTRGTAVPPMPGQLIPMAISLGQPRSGSGLSQPVVISTTRPARDHDVSNVAIVEMQAPEEPRRPQLDIQVLPSVDIDSTPPTPAPSDRVSPPKAQVEEKDDMIDGTGISLPGYDESPSVYHGPPFPPQQPAPQVVAVPSSDVLAEEIGRRDLFENRAIEWVEQELMARIISQMRPREEDEPDILRPDSPVSSEATDESVIVDGMGNAGLQLFVDSGHPVSSDLVNALVREVIEEKLAAMLGQQLADRQRPRSPPPSPRQVVEEQPPRQPTPPPFIPRERVSTPVVTPHASPIHTPPPPAVRSPLDTPDVTPEGSIVMVPESETDSDMREPTPPPEPTPIKMPDSPVQTPISTPPRTPPPKAPTPLPSPRDSPIPSVQEPSPSPSPKPWTEEELPIDEELPSRDREEEPLRPVVLTLEPDIEGGDVIQIPILTPPKRATPPPSSPSDVSSSSPEPSTFTETTDRDISDGEWLLSRSEGQILPKTRLGQDGFRVAFDHQANKPDDSGSSRDSTLHETEDIEADVTQAFSEGEVLGKKIPIHKDPMLALLARLSQQASVVMPSQEANYLHPATQTSEAEISAGEVSWGQRPSYTTVAEKIVYGQSGHLKPEKSRSTARQLQSGSPGEVELTSGDRPLRVSELDSPKSGRSPKSKHSKSPRSPKSPKSPKSLSQKTPSRVIQVGRSESPRSPRASSASRVIRVGGKPASPPPSSRVIHFSGLDDEQPADDMPQGMAQSTNDLEAQTPDQMQLDALILSGYLSQTFSQSDGAISEMDRSKLPSGLTLGGSAPGTLLVTLPSAEESVEDFDISGASFEQQDDSTISDVSEFSAAQL